MRQGPGKRVVQRHIRRPPDPSRAREAQEAVAAIEDEGLRAALARLGAAALSRGGANASVDDNRASAAVARRFDHCPACPRPSTCHNVRLNQLYRFKSAIPPAGVSGPDASGTGNDMTIFTTTRRPPSPDSRLRRRHRRVARSRRDRIWPSRRNPCPARRC